MYERYIVAEGNAYERGVSIGRQLKDAILCNYKNAVFYYHAKENFEYDVWKKMAERYIPFIKEWAPEVYDEMRGMADGAEVDFDVILSLQTEYEKSFARDQVSEKCTSFMARGLATKNGKIIAAQTNDENLREWRHERDCAIHHKDPNGDEILIYTHPGASSYMGMNNHGVVVLWTYIDNGVTGNGLPTIPIIRHLLSLHDVDSAVKFLETVPHDIPNQFGICDKYGNLASVECFPNKVYVKRDENFFAHTNHNVHAGNEPECCAGVTTFDRLKTITRLVKDNWGNIDVPMTEEFFRNHENGTHSICVHPNGERPWSKTLATMIFLPEEGRLHIAFGNACEVPFHDYKFDKLI